MAWQGEAWCRSAFPTRGTMWEHARAWLAVQLLHSMRRRRGCLPLTSRAQPRHENQALPVAPAAGGQKAWAAAAAHSWERQPAPQSLPSLAQPTAPAAPPPSQLAGLQPATACPAAQCAEWLARPAPRCAGWPALSAAGHAASPPDPQRPKWCTAAGPQRLKWHAVGDHQRLKWRAAAGPQRLKWRGAAPSACSVPRCPLSAACPASSPGARRTCPCNSHQRQLRMQHRGTRG